MKITHDEVWLFSSTPCFSTKSPSTFWSCTNVERVNICIIDTMLCPAHIANLSQTSYHGLCPSGLQIGGNPWVLVQGCRTDGVTLSKLILWFWSILLWLLFESSVLCVTMHCHAETRFLLALYEARLVCNASWVLSAFWCRCLSWLPPLLA